jgi:hypothetical protein
LRQFGQPAHLKIVARDVDQPALVLDVEMEMVRRVGVEIAAVALDGDLAQQPASVNWLRVL